MDSKIISSWTDEDRRQILKKLRSLPPIHKDRLPLFYRAGILLVAIAMVILPLIYLTLIAAIIYGLYWHIVHDISIFSGHGSKQGAFFVFITPIVIGVTLLLFLVKPLFARRGRQSTLLKVKKEDEPFLFEFIEELARIVGAPRPGEIQLSSDINAYAGFRQGLASFIFANDLSLTIGLPLLEGMNLQQLAGIIAHEFGHFRQGGAMRLSYIVRSVNAWFARVVYERDSWDETLEHWSKNSDFRIMIILFIVRLFVWLVRRILWVLMIIGHLISCFMLRQMEYDADRCEIAFEGSENFIETSYQLFFLSLSFHIARNDVTNTWQQEGRLADNWGEMIKVSMASIGAQDRDEIIENIKQSRTGWLDTHPADIDRIHEAEKMAMPCMFDCNFIASILFSNLKDVAAKLSLDLYREALDENIEMKQLVPAAVIVDRKEQEADEIKAVERFFQCRFSGARILSLDSLEGEQTALSVEQLCTQITEAREYILEHVDEYWEKIQEFEQREERLIELKKAKMLVEADFSISESEFHLPEVDVMTIRRHISIVEQEIRAVSVEMEKFEKRVMGRINSSARLFLFSEIGDKQPLAQGKDEFRKFWSIAVFVFGIMPEIRDLNHRFSCLNLLAQNLSEGKGGEQAINLCKAAYKKMRNIISNLRKKSEHLTYPFEHIEGELSLGAFLVKEIPEHDNFEANFFTCVTLIDRAFTLYLRVIAKLAATTEQVEAVIGLASFEQPEPREEISAEQKYIENS